MLTGLKHIFPICLSTRSLEKDVTWNPGHILSFSIPIMYFQSHYMVVFVGVYEEFYIFAVIMDPFRTSLLAPYLYILNSLC